MTLKIIVKGKANGIALVSKKPMNFLGAIDKKTGKVRDENHDLFGKSLAEKILVFPFGVGSSVGAYTIYSLRSNKCAPQAMICLKADLTTASGCALANIPLVVVSKDEYDSIKDGTKILLDAENGKIL
jgi:predicted aconitase with swiveling domain